MRAGRQRETISVRDLNVWYGNFLALKNINHRDPCEGHHGADRPVGLRQVHVPAQHQPDERSDTVACRTTGEIWIDGQNVASPGDRRGRAAQEHRNGLPAAQSVPEVHIRQRRLRPEESTALATGQEIAEIVEKSLGARRYGTR